MAYIHIIWNPVAGNGAANAAYEQVSQYLKQMSVPYTSSMSEFPGHAAKLAATAAEQGYARIIVLGGDGTIHEVAPALMGKDCALGIIPCGTGNDLVRALNIPNDTMQALEIALTGVPRPMDALMANDELCFNVAGFGFDVDVLDKTELYKRKTKNGSIAYIRGLVTALSKLQLRKTHLSWPEGEMDANVLIVAAGNGTHFGGGMKVTPKADPFDGLLDICVISDAKMPKALPLLLKFLKGEHLESKYTTYFHTTELTAVCEPSSRIDVDGEVMEGTPVTFRILPKALNVIAGSPHTAD